MSAQRIARTARMDSFSSAPLAGSLRWTSCRAGWRSCDPAARRGGCPCGCGRPRNGGNHMAGNRRVSWHAWSFPEFLSGVPAWGSRWAGGLGVSLPHRHGFPRGQKRRRYSWGRGMLGCDAVSPDASRRVFEVAAVGAAMDQCRSEIVGQATPAEIRRGPWTGVRNPCPHSWQKPKDFQSPVGCDARMDAKTGACLSHRVDGGE